MLLLCVGECAGRAGGEGRGRRLCFYHVSNIEYHRVEEGGPPCTFLCNSVYFSQACWLEQKLDLTYD